MARMPKSFLSVDIEGSERETKRRKGGKSSRTRINYCRALKLRLDGTTYSLRKKVVQFNQKSRKKCITTKSRKQMRFLKYFFCVFNPSKLQKNCRKIGKRQFNV